MSANERIAERVSSILIELIFDMSATFIEPSMRDKRKASFGDRLAFEKSTPFTNKGVESNNVSLVTVMPSLRVKQKNMICQGLME